MKNVEAMEPEPRTTSTCQYDPWLKKVDYTASDAGKDESIAPPAFARRVFRVFILQ